jgi:hypothetical protein
LFDLAVEALVRGLNPKELDEPELVSYREGARAKQLPPDTEDWVDLLAIEDSETQVSVVSDVINPETNKPRLIRVDQLSPEEQAKWLKGFFIWFIRSGRGFGKSWTGSNWINEGAERATGEYMAIMGRDAHDVRAFCIEGDSGTSTRSTSHPSVSSLGPTVSRLRSSMPRNPTPSEALTTFEPGLTSLPLTRTLTRASTPRPVRTQPCPTC